jgi:Peptidase family C25/FG-GAP-like repeat
MIKLSWFALAVTALFSGVVPVHAATTIEREFRYPATRMKLTQNSDGTTQVVMPELQRDFTPGHPDLPLAGERVDLPDGMRVSAVEVIAVETAPLATNSRIATAQVIRPGLGPIDRTAPDPKFFTGSSALPSVLASLGAQGFERGHNVAWLQVSPVRWTPGTGLLERVDRVRVRLTLEPTTEAPLARERIVPEWEDHAVVTRPAGRTVGPTSLVRREGDASAFRPTQVPSVLGSPVAYVIITNDDMAAQFQRLADWKTQCGVPAVVRTTSFINAQYPFGADDAERIRLFIRDAYTRWGIKWVLLGGDTDVIPTRLARTEFYGGEMIACDNYFACLDRNWNADGDSLYGEAYNLSANPGDNIDLMPEVYVGRAPTVTVAQAQQFVDKSLQYEKTPVGDYEQNLLLFAEVLFPQDWSTGQLTSLDGAELVEDLLPRLNANPQVHYQRLYENYTDSRWQPGALQERRVTVLDSLDRGYNIAVHVGHGYRNVMSVGDDNLTNADAQALTNGNRLINLYAIDCTSNAIDFPCIGEAFLHAPNGGAVTNIGSTRFDFPTAGRSYQKAYFDTLYRDSITAVGAAQALSKLPFVAFSTYDGVNRWTQLTLLLLGDPELHIYLGTPRTLTVTAPGTLVISDSTFNVNVAIGGVPLYGARVTAYRPNDEFFTTLTDGAGNAVLAFRPDSTGSMTLTVTGFDCRPYQVTIPIVNSVQPTLAARPAVIDDDNAGGTIGNANGIFDAGETVDLLIPIKNNGGLSALGVTATLSTTDGLVTVVNPNVTYGTIGAGTLTSPAAGFRVSLPFSAADQREIPFNLRLVDSANRSYLESFQVVARAPDLHHYAHVINDVGGTPNGISEPGETCTYGVKLRNLGTGLAQGVTAKLRSLDGLSTVTDSTSSWGDIGTGLESQGDPLVFVPTSTSAKLQLRVSDQYGELWTQMLDLLPPPTPADLLGTGAATTIKLTWARIFSTDLLGYNVYRSSSSGGPFVRINSIPTERTAYFQDSGLLPLTRYYYKVSAVDSTGNESPLSVAQFASTNPPTHAIFPIPMGGNTPSSVAIDHVYSGYPVALVAGSDFLYCWNPDGTAPVDADGAGSTSGDFTKLGNYYAAGPSIADIDGGAKEIIAPSWYSQQVFVFDPSGNLKPGWPISTIDPVWSSVAVGDLNNDGQKELVFGSNGTKLYVFRANGTEWMDGDANPTTNGVFKVLGSDYNFGTPALADLDGNGELDIIYGSFDGYLYAWRPSGANLPGFPVNLHGPITASVAVGYLDGPGDTQLDIVVPTGGDSLFVIRADGSCKPGFPLWLKLGGSSKTPSPALADMNADGFVDIIVATTGGGIYCWNHNGILQFPWGNIRFSPLTSGATESSPVVADINGDGVPDVVMGDETGELAAMSGVDGSMLAGFPIQLDGEVRGTPAVCDCDGDGKTELVLAGWDKNLYMWDYDFPFSPAQPPAWPQFHHDAARTGVTTSPIFVGVDDPTPSTIPTAIEFAAPAPNPARVGSRMDYAIPAGHEGERFELAVYDLTGRRVQSLATGTAHSGRYSAAWNLRGADGSRADAGVYFVRFTLGSSARTRKLVIIH